MVVWKRCLRVLCFFREDCQKKQKHKKIPQNTNMDRKLAGVMRKRIFFFCHFNKRRISTVFPLQWFIQWKSMWQSSRLNCPIFFLVIIIMTRLYFLFLFAFVKRLRLCLNICIYDKYLYLCIVTHNVELIVYIIVLFLWPHHTVNMVVL